MALTVDGTSAKADKTIVGKWIASPAQKVQQVEAGHPRQPQSQHQAACLLPIVSCQKVFRRRRGGDFQSHRGGKRRHHRLDLRIVEDEINQLPTHQRKALAIDGRLFRASSAHAPRSRQLFRPATAVTSLWLTGGSSNSHRLRSLTSIASLFAARRADAQGEYQGLPAKKQRGGRIEGGAKPQRLAGGPSNSGAQRDQAGADGVARETGNVVDVEGFHQLASVGLCRFDADVEDSWRSPWSCDPPRPIAALRAAAA